VKTKTPKTKDETGLEATRHKINMEVNCSKKRATAKKKMLKFQTKNYNKNNIAFLKECWEHDVWVIGKKLDVEIKDSPVPLSCFALRSCQAGRSGS